MKANGNIWKHVYTVNIRVAICRIGFVPVSFVLGLSASFTLVDKADRFGQESGTRLRQEIFEEQGVPLQVSVYFSYE